MRKKFNTADIENYFVTVSRDHPRSEEGIALADFFGMIAPTAPIDEAALIARVDTLVADRLAAQPVPPPREPEPARVEPDVSDLPAFLRKMAPQPAESFIPEITAHDAISAINEIESRMMQAIEGLARRLDEVSAKLEMDPVEFKPNGHAEAVNTLTNWMQSIEQRANDAMALAARMAETPPVVATIQAVPPQVPLVDPVPPPLLPPREAAIARVRHAATSKRSSSIGETADERDTLQRLVEIALNARAANGMAITRMEAMAGVSGRKWDELARDIIASHDGYTDITVKTRIIELVAISDLTMAQEASIDGIVAKAIADLERAGAP